MTILDPMALWGKPMSNKQMLALIDQAPALLEALEEILELEESHHSLTEAGCIARDAIERVRSES